MEPVLSDPSAAVRKSSAVHRAAALLAALACILCAQGGVGAQGVGPLAASPSPGQIVATGQILDAQAGYVFFTTGDGFRIDPSAPILSYQTKVPWQLKVRPRLYARATFNAANGHIIALELSSRPVLAEGRVAFVRPGNRDARRAASAALEDAGGGVRGDGGLPEPDHLAAAQPSVLMRQPPATVDLPVPTLPSRRIAPFPARPAQRTPRRWPQASPPDRGACGPDLFIFAAVLARWDASGGIRTTPGAVDAGMSLRLVDRVDGSGATCGRGILGIRC